MEKVTLILEDDQWTLAGTERGSGALFIAVCAGKVDLFLTSGVFDLEVAVVDIFLDVVAVAVFLLILLKDHFRVQLGGKLFVGRVIFWRMESQMGMCSRPGMRALLLT